MKVIIALTGYSGSGKGKFAKRVERLYGIPTVSTGSVVRAELARLGLEWTPANLNSVSDKLRRQSGNRFCSLIAPAVRKAFLKSDFVIVDSIRESMDLVLLKTMSDSVETVAILANQRERYRRMRRRRRQADPATWSEFLKLNRKADKLGMRKMMDSASHRLENNRSFTAFNRRIDSLMKFIVQKYKKSN